MSYGIAIIAVPVLLLPPFWLFLPQVLMVTFGWGGK
jgi:hypothetical protein